MNFDHAGVATTDLGRLRDLYGELLGCDLAHSEHVDGMDVAFLDVGNGYLELLEPSAEGPIAAYLDGHGPGIHHLAFATEDVPRALKRARNVGVEPIDEHPRDGAWGHDVAFLHPDSTGGVLLEFVEH